MREGKKGERAEARRPPIMPRGERALIYFYILRSGCSDFPQSSPRSPRVRISLSFLGSLQQFALFGGWARLFCMPALSGSSRVHVNRMKSSQRIEGVYWVMMGGPSIGLQPGSSCGEEFLGIKVRGVFAGCRSLA